MAGNRGTLRLAAILGFIAAALAVSACVVRYLKTKEMDLRIAAAGIFMAALALNAWTKAKSDAPTQ